MYIKIKKMNDAKLVLDLTNGTYIIGMRIPALKIGDGDYTPMHTEIIEEHDSMDYRIEEMVERFNVVYEVLKEENYYNVSKCEKSYDCNIKDVVKELENKRDELCTLKEYIECLQSHALLGDNSKRERDIVKLNKDIDYFTSLIIKVNDLLKQV